MRDARTGDPINNFKWQVNLDNSHDNTDIPWPIASYSPVIATGNQDDPNVALPIADALFNPNPGDPANPLNRGYLVTVLANDGVGTLNDPDYKIGGQHFKVTGSGGTLTVEVELQPNPLPLATIRVKVFHDNQMVNGAEDQPVEAGLAGFHVTLHDRIGEVTVDWNGDPLCGGYCVSDSNGDVVIPNLGPNKYAVEVIPPDGQGWIQTTTIEGKHEIDGWVAEGDSGFSSEGELGQNLLWFGFVKECKFGNTGDDCTSAAANTVGTNTIRGVAHVTTEIGGEGGPVPHLLVALNNTGGDDEQVYTASGNADGSFVIPNVPDGSYQIVLWDEPLDYIISFFTVQVTGGQDLNLGTLLVPAWFSHIQGYTYIDQNGNGVRDPGEPPLPRQDLDTRFKDGSIQQATFADDNGFYQFTEVPPLLNFNIAEVGYGRFKQIGAAAYASDLQGNPQNYPNNPINQDLGLASLLQATSNWAGLTNYIDWGKQEFAPGENGGIVGIVFNATTRNELNARFQANEDYEPGVPDVPVYLYKPVLDANGEPVKAADGSILKDHLAAVYSGTDSWYANLPTDCRRLDSFGRNAAAGEVAPDPEIWDHCLEVLLALQNQVRPGVFDGGYAFDLDCSNPAATDPFDPAQLLDPGQNQCTPIAEGDWIVEIAPPTGFKAVREEDINVFDGDVYQPAIPPPPCAGPLHTVDVQNSGTDGYPSLVVDGSTVPASIPVYNPNFADTGSPDAPNGGSPYEGQPMPSCQSRLVTLQPGQNSNSDFFVFTDVPQPGRMQGFLSDDLHFDLDPAKANYGSNRGIPHTSVGIRDFTGKLLQMVETDDNGYFEALLPSTGTYNCPVPAGPCPGMYVIIGNDPGDPGNPSPHWNPNYGSLRVVLDFWPGLTTLADIAIAPITGFVGGETNIGTQFDTPFACELPAATPELHFVSQPYGPPGASFTIQGKGFGATQGAGSVTLDGVPIAVTGWSDGLINVTVPGVEPVGSHQLLVTNANGAVSPTGITFHVLGAGYNPPQKHVGPGQAYATIQAALDAANAGDLILVHPGTYFESIIIDKNVKLQGFGPGPSAFGVNVAGDSVIDGRFFNVIYDPLVFTARIAAAAPFGGSPDVPTGQVITVLAAPGEFGATSYLPQIDGLAIRGGTRSQDEGGGIYLHAYANKMLISNNIVQSNAGNYGGGILVSRPNTPNPDAGNALDAQNDNLHIHHNRILENGGLLRGGGVAIFNGTENFEIDHNIVCGNYSAEYGAGISNFGFSSGSIHDNEIMFNNAFDEGGGIMIAGEDAVAPAISPGAGNINIERNLIRSNVTNDDGGGIRLLTPVDGRIRIINNMIVNNLATDAGGGISLDDALNVEIINNTVAKNVSTATAEDADRSSCNPGPFATCPHGAGLVSHPHSPALIAAKSLPANSFSNPVLFNNIFWDNQAWHLSGPNTLYANLAGPVVIDLEVVFGNGAHFSPTYSDCTSFTADCPNNGNNRTDNPQFVQEIPTNFLAAAYTLDPTLVTVLIKATPSDPPGNYHVNAASAVVNTGTASVGVFNAPCDDFDGNGRPNGPAHDIGADEQPGGPPCSAVTNLLYFSTEGDTAVPGVVGPYDDADIYKWNGATFSRVFDGSAFGLPAAGGGNADIDALLVVDEDTFYMSFAADTTIDVAPPGPANNITVQDEDVVRYDAGTWSLYLDGTAAGLASNGGGGLSEDVDAFEILSDGSLVVSTDGNADIPGIAGNNEQDEDLFRCVPGGAPPIGSCTWNLYLDGTAAGIGLANNTGDAEDVDGVAVLNNNVYLSTRGAFAVPGPLNGDNEDVFVCNSPSGSPITGCSSFSLFFDGSTKGVTDNLDAFDIVLGAAPAANPSLAITVTGTPNPAEAGSQLTYTIQVTNTGNVNLTARITDTRPISVTPSGPITFTPIITAPGGVWTQQVVVTVNPGISGTITNTVQVTTLEGASGSYDLASQVVAPPPGSLPAAQLYLSLASNGTYTVTNLGGVTDEDIIGWTGGSNFVMVFDGSDVSIPAAADIDAFYIVDPNLILLSFEAGVTLPGVGTVTDADVVQFTATSLGSNTAGSFSLFFDGSDVGLTTVDEDVDAIERLPAPDSRLLLSTLGNANVTGLPTQQDEDVLAFTPTSTGATTSGTWDVYFDGTDVGLTVNDAEDVDGLSVAADGKIYLSTRGNFAVTGVSGANEDVFVCAPSSLGATTACTYSPTLFFDGSLFGLTGNDVDAVELP
ncbi:MAG: IPT/TIG domain-containing protein [Anaerolineae bacterium]